MHPARTCGAPCAVRRAPQWSFRQLSAACCRSSGFSSNWTSFSASAKVTVETGGPTSGDVPKGGGAPAGGSAGLLFRLVTSGRRGHQDRCAGQKVPSRFCHRIIVSCPKVASRPHTARIVVYLKLDRSKAPTHRLREIPFWPTKPPVRTGTAGADRLTRSGRGIKKRYRYLRISSGFPSGRLGPERRSRGR